MGSLSVRSAAGDEIFRIFTNCTGDEFANTLIFDVRPYKDFAKSHIYHSFCVRIPISNESVLLVGACNP
jgi:hypothetical protein